MRSVAAGRTGVSVPAEARTAKARLMASSPAINQFTVYGLYDPAEPDHCRYVGQTKRLKARLLRHIRMAKAGEGPYKSAWIGSLLREGRTPVCRVLAHAVTQADLDANERTWINRLREEGHRLTNLTDGGFGGTVKGRPMADATKAKLRAAHLGKRLSVEHRAKLSEAARHRKPISAATRARLSEAQRGIPKPKPARCRGPRPDLMGRVPWNKGRRMSLEERERNRQSQLKRWADPMQRARMSDAHRGKRQSEETKRKHADALRRAWLDPERGQRLRAGHAKRVARLRASQQTHQEMRDGV